MRWDTKQKCIDDITFRYDTAHEWLVLAGVDYTDAYWHWAANNDHLAIFEIIQAWSDIKNMVNNILILNTSVTPRWAVPYCLQNYTGADITMSAMLKAMHEAEPHQPLLFMGYLEAYKASVWNASFDENFFANLVKKWSIWD